MQEGEQSRDQIDQGSECTISFDQWLKGKTRGDRDCLRSSRSSESSRSSRWRRSLSSWRDVRESNGFEEEEEVRLAYCDELTRDEMGMKPPDMTSVQVWAAKKGFVYD